MWTERKMGKVVEEMENELLKRGRAVLRKGRGA